MKEGGLTPSHGVIKRVLGSVRIPIQVMVCPNSFGFRYDENDWNIMKEDILFIRSLGGKRIVFGCLTENNLIDEVLLEKVIKLVPDIDITFDRAFDLVASQTEAYRTLTKYTRNVKRILTSGGKDKAPQAIPELRGLVKLSKELKGPKIMVGSGVTPENINTLKQQTGADLYHIGSGLRQNGDFRNGLDAEKIKALRQDSF